MNKINRVLLMLLVFFFFVETASAQSDKREQRKMEKAEKKRLKEEAAQRNQELLKELVEEQRFVLEANSIIDRNLNRYEVMPNTNFVKIEGKELTVQTSNNYSMGYNGLGGITIKGSITSYKIQPSKDGSSHSIIINFNSPLIGQSTLSLNIQAQGMSRAMVTDNWGGRATFQGQVVSIENSRIFQGRTII